MKGKEGLIGISGERYEDLIRKEEKLGFILKALEGMEGYTNVNLLKTMLGMTVKEGEE